MLAIMTTDNLLPVTCEVPASLLPWLAYKQSLTKRLQEKAGNTHLEILEQCWQAPDWWDKQVLQINEEAVFHRKILMSSSGEPCWYARTVIPQSTYNAEKKIFNRLKKESLGTLVFKEAKISRSSLIYYPINTQSIEYHWPSENVLCQAETLWARLSIFVIDKNLPFCLIEIMLPGIMRFPN